MPIDRIARMFVFVWQVNPRNENLFKTIQFQRMQQWNAVLGNLTPTYGGRVLNILLDFILGRGSAQACSEERLPILLQSMMHVRVSVAMHSNGSLSWKLM